MENPQSEALGLPPHERHTVSFCDYGRDYPGGGDIYRCIFTNDDIWNPFPCEQRPQGAAVPDEDQIPEQLLQEIFNPYLFFYEEQQQRQGYSGAAVPTLVSDFVQPMKPPKPQEEDAGEEEEEDMPGLVSAPSSSSDEDEDEEDERMESQEFQTPRDASSG